jgi:hypothetical protein
MKIIIAKELVSSGKRKMLKTRFQQFYMYELLLTLLNNITIVNSWLSDVNLAQQSTSNLQPYEKALYLLSPFP